MTSSVADAFSAVGITRGMDIDTPPRYAQRIVREMGARPVEFFGTGTVVYELHAEHQPTKQAKVEKAMSWLRQHGYIELEPRTSLWRVSARGRDWAERGGAVT